MDVEVFSFKALEKAWKEAKLQSEREHVTPYIWKNSKIFTCINLENDIDLSYLRLTVDEKEDLVLLNKLHKKINSEDCGIEEIVETINKNPELSK